MSSDPIVFVDGVQTTFLASLTDFESMITHELLSQAFTGLLSRTGVSSDQVDYLCAGTVQQEVRTSNITKEAAFDARFPLGIPGHTVTMACISANQAVTTCMGLLATGRAVLCIAGGWSSDLTSLSGIHHLVVKQLLMKTPRARGQDSSGRNGKRL